MRADALSVQVMPSGDPDADAELDAFFAACPASFAQQTVGWREVIGGLSADEPMFLGCRSNGGPEGDLVGVLPAYRFAGPQGAILCSVPQAGPLGGVACRGVDAEAIYASLIESYVGLAKATECALATLITNPIWPDRERCERLLAPDYVLENSCLVLDLEQALDADGNITTGSSHLRRNLRRAESGALRIDEEQSAENVDVWYEIHHTRHTEIGARPLPRELFRGALTHMVPRGKARFFFVRRSDDREMVAGGLYVGHGSVVDALMPSMQSSAAKLSPNYLLAVHSMRWARSQGLRHYNWQASPPDGGVYAFKQQWGSRDRDYVYLTRITGDAEPFLRSTPAELAEAYPWHYVLPYDRVGAGAKRDDGPSSRGDAWRAREGSRP